MSLWGGISPVATPDPPPTLPGPGGRIIDPAFGATIIQATDATNTGGASAHHGYVNRSSFNYDNTKLLLNIGSQYWWYAFNPSTLVLTTTGNAISFPLSGLVPYIWDFSGSRNNILYYTINSPSPANRLFREYDAAAATHTTIKDFRSAVRLSGVIQSGSSSTVFVHTEGNPTSPITDLTSHFFVSQKVLFTGNVTAALANDTAVISAYDDETRQLTVGAGLSVAPAAGDTFYIEPAGYNGQFEATMDGRWLMVAITHLDGVGGQDRPRVLYAWDRINDVSYLGYLTAADTGGGGLAGAHQVHATYREGRPYLWASVAGATSAYCLWDAQANIVYNAVNFSHADTGPNGQLVTNVEGGTGVKPVTSPGDITTIWQVPRKEDKIANNVTSYDGWTCHLTQANRIIHSAYVGDLHIGWNAPTTQFVSDTAPVYRCDNYLSLYTGRTIHLTPANLGVVWASGVQCTYMGTTKASIVASGQWAYDPAGSSGNGQLWVRGGADEDLSAEATNRVLAFDWRTGYDEILLIHNNGGTNTDRFTRVCKAYTRSTAPGASSVNANIAANISRDGRFGVWASTWGNRSRRDVFIVVIDRAIAASARPANTATPAVTARPVVTLRPTVLSP